MQGKHIIMSRRKPWVLSIVLLSASGIALGACSSSSGSDSSPPKTVIIPANSKIVCVDGTEPPCR